MEVNPDYERLYELRPGLFSEATLTNGYTGTLEKMLTRLEMDLDYLENRSLWGGHTDHIQDRHLHSWR